MKFLVRSVVDNKGYASAAELYVEAEALVPRNYWFIPPINTEHHYRIREKQSGLCLHYQTNQSEGHFCLGRFNENDQTYIFTFEQAKGFTAFYKIKANGHYMSFDVGASWRIISSTTTPNDRNGYIQVERLEDGNAYLRCGWQNSLLVGLDSRNVGNYIYANKTSPCEFILEDIEAEEEAIGIERVYDSANEQTNRQQGGLLYNLSGQQVSPSYRGIVVKRTSDGKAKKMMRQ